MSMQDGNTGMEYSWGEILSAAAAIITAIGGAMVAIRKSKRDEKHTKTDIVESNINALSDIITGMKVEIDRLKYSRDEEVVRAEKWEERAHVLEELNDALRNRIRILERANRELVSNVAELKEQIEKTTNDVRKVARRVGVPIDGTNTDTDAERAEPTTDTDPYTDTD